MFGLAYFHVQALQLVLFCLAFFAAYATYKNKVLSYVAVFLVAAWFLGLKGYQYITIGRIPMDISAVCYFLYGICVILPFRPAKVTIAQLATLCGLVYGICMIALPQVFHARDPNEFGRYFAIANHAMLLFGGLAMMGHVRFKRSDIFWTLTVLVVIVVYIEICVACGVAEGTAIFSKIVNATVILEVFPEFTMPWWYYIAYYGTLFTLLALWLALTYAVNRRVAFKHLKTGLFAY